MTDPAARADPATVSIDELIAAVDEAFDRSEIAAAERVARKALDLIGRLPPGRDRARREAAAARALGTALRTVGSYGAAEGAFDRALDAVDAGFGPDSIEAAEVLNDLGMTFKYAGRFGDAAAAYAQVRTILESTPDADPDDLAALFHNLAGLEHARGDFAAAEPLARRGIELRAGLAEPGDPALLLDRSAHAAILDGLGRTAEAEAIIREVLPGLEAIVGRDHPEVAVALNNLAAIVGRRGDLDEAEGLYRRVIAIREARLGVDSAGLAAPLNNLGTVLRAANRPDEADHVFERALQLLEGAVDDDHPTLRAIRQNAGRSAADDRRGSRGSVPDR